MNTDNIPANPANLHEKRLSDFLEEIQNFKTRFYSQEPEMMQNLLEYGQNPLALVISCCDSRVDPALLMNAAPGDLFVVRNVANLVPPYHVTEFPDSISTAIEYAVRDLKVQHIIILGHAHCGGIKALINSVDGVQLERDFIGNWVALAKNACQLNASESALSIEQIKQYSYLVERAAIQGSIKNLLTYPWLLQAVQQNQLTLHGWWFDLATGDLWVIDGEDDCFMPMS